MTGLLATIDAEIDRRRADLATRVDMLSASIELAEAVATAEHAHGYQVESLEQLLDLAANELERAALIAITDRATRVPAG